MSNIPAELKYTESHEWVRKESDGTITVGITEFAQDALGDIVFVELPKVGAELAATKSFGTVESVKAVSELYAPVSGTVTAINEELATAPEKINSEKEARILKLLFYLGQEIGNAAKRPEWNSESYKEIVEEKSVSAR